MSSEPRQSIVAVLLTTQAIADLRAIEEYSIRLWGNRTAARYLDEIAAALMRIKSTPEILRMEPEIIPNLRFYRVNKHFLVCDYTELSIVVLTIIHTSMDLPRRLLELEPGLSVEAQILRHSLHGGTSNS